MFSKLTGAALVLAATTSLLFSQGAPPQKAIPPGSKIFLSPVEGGFENYLAAGLYRKKVPVAIVNNRDQADYELTSVAETEKAGWAKILFMGNDSSREQAGIKLTKIDTGEVVFAYAVHKGMSAKGKQSAAEACAKHLKKQIT